LRSSTTAPRNDRSHAVPALERGNQCCGRAGARAEIADGQRLQFRLRIDPIGREHQTLREQRDVEAMLARVHVALLFGAGQKVEEERCQPGALQLRRDPDVPRAPAAAAAAVCEQQDALRAGRHGEIPGERRVARGNRNFALDVIGDLLSHVGAPCKPWSNGRNKRTGHRRPVLALQGIHETRIAVRMAGKPGFRARTDVIVTTADAGWCSTA
jgi:hypothetical protein